MTLFVCSNQACRTVDNTALAEIFPHHPAPLCTVCQGRPWHNEFPRTIREPEEAFKGLRNASQAKRASAEVDRLERLVKSGTATPEEAERYAVGMDMVLIWGWAEDGRNPNK